MVMRRLAGSGRQRIDGFVSCEPKTRMAGSRLEKFGTIFSRMKGLITSGAVKEHDKPLWLDVFAAFPPHVEPKRYRPTPDVHIKQIFYPEDKIRAHFYSAFGSPGVIDLASTEKQYKTVAQKFVDTYLETAKASPELSDEEVFKKTKSLLINEGVLLKKTPKQEIPVDGEERAKTKFVQTQPGQTKKSLGISVKDILKD